MTIATALTPTTGTWVLDPAHTRLGFEARHAMVSKVRGNFGIFEGTLVLDGENPANSRATVVIDAASISTGSADRDAHLRSADFLNVEEFPTLTFTSTAVRHEGDAFVMVGELTIRGTTRPVEIRADLEGVVDDPWGNTKIGFEGLASLSRKDFGLTWNVALEAGGVLVSDTIKIVLDVQAARQA
jgi:polyisoprenoid-binding protein YceI